MKPATYDELLEAGLICPDTPHDIVYRYMTTLHRDPPAKLFITIVVEGGVIQDISSPYPDQIDVRLIDLDEDPSGTAIIFPVTRGPMEH